MYDRLRDLAVSVDGCEFALRERDTSSDFTRVTTVVTLEGDGIAGRGEDVTYDEEEHRALLDAEFPLEGEYTLDGFSATLDDVDLFPAGAPDQDAFRHYRRWAFESAALDLALRQAGMSLGGVLDRSYDPVRFVVSTRLGDPPTVDRLRTWLANDPELAFKLDPTSDWTADLVDEIAATGAVEALDLKGQYEGTIVDQPVDPDLYELVIAGFPDAIVEDPELTDETREILRGHEHRVAWDYPITGIDAIEELPFEPGWINVKPSRFGTVRSLLATIDHCSRADIYLYGGGQFELDVGRDQVQALASLFYPDAPNDVAPGGYNAPEPESGLPSSPLAPGDPAGFAFRRRPD